LPTLPRLDGLIADRLLLEELRRDELPELLLLRCWLKPDFGVLMLGRLLLRLALPREELLDSRRLRRLSSAFPRLPRLELPLLRDALPELLPAGGRKMLLDRLRLSLEPLPRLLDRLPLKPLNNSDLLRLELLLPTEP